jgi:hypothetical protein
VDSFGSLEEQFEYMQSVESALNPMGTAFDPDAWAAAYPIHAPRDRSVPSDA